MSSAYASGKYSIAECDRCGQRFMLRKLRKEIIKTRLFNIKVCNECFDPDQPQLSIGMYPVYDPQAVREPRPDSSYQASGTSGLQIGDNNSTSIFGVGFQEGGSRVFQWGWNPVGGSRNSDIGLTPNSLVLNFQLTSVTISTT